MYKGVKTKKSRERVQMDLYQIITDKIIEKLEKGSVPWKRSYSEGNFPVNWKTGKVYRGINLLLLEAGEYATFKQIKEAGGKVKKGAKSQTIIFWKKLDVEDKEGEKKKIPMLKKYQVFEINTQVEGLESKREVVKNDNNTIDIAKEIVDNYFSQDNAPKRVKKIGVPCYIPMQDKVCMPDISDFTGSEEYYSTYYHEMVHSTGHQTRLNREGVTGKLSFGSESYSKEELIAEIGANMLCMVSEIDDKTFDNSVSYINSWLQQLRNDKKLIVTAAQKAQKAIDLILGTEFEGGK